MQNQKPIQEREWSNGLFSCFNDISICLGACCIPCCQFGINKGEYNGNYSTGDVVYNACYYLLAAYCGCHSCVGGSFRSELRQQYKIKGDSCGDCMVHFCCAPCALAQEAQEIKLVNNQRQAYPATVMVPPQQPYMQQPSQATMYSPQ